MEQTFFFYDLETSGLDPRADRLMQFAGQRTDLDMNPIGDRMPSWLQKLLHNPRSRMV